MTIRQVLLNYSSAGVGSSISYVGAASATTTSVTPPTHTTGDLLVAFATGSSAITLPAGWTSIGSDNFTPFSGAVYLRCAYKVAASGSETSGTWTGASRLTIVNYRGAASAGTAVFKSGTSTMTWRAVSLTVTDGTSWVVGLGYQSSDGNTNPPTGMTHRTSVDSNKQVVHDTASGVSSWSQQTTSTIAAASATYTFELVSA